MSGVLVARDGVEAFVAEARTLEKRAPSRVPLWLRNVRRDALEAFLELGFPAPDAEEWRYTNVAPIARQAWRTELNGTGLPLRARPGLKGALELLAPLGVLERTARRLVFVNGWLDADLSHADGPPPGVTFESLAHALEKEPGRLQAWLASSASHEKHPFVALNTAFLSDGAFLQVPDGTVVAEPFHVVHVTDATAGPLAAHARTLAVLGENAQATLQETYVSAGEAAFSNPVTEAVLGPHAMLDHYTVQEEGGGTFHVGNLLVRQARGSQLFTHLVSFGGRLVRNEATVLLDGEGAGATLDGLFLAKGDQHVDNHTLIDHARPHCGSQELYKGILAGRARGAFDGKIVVRPHAQKTDAHQKNRNLLLSGEATIDTKPQLEIYNNDVRCTHGSATGRLDPDALFYLRSRGLDERAARALLTYAFASEIAGRVKGNALKAALEERILAWLPANGSDPEAP